MDGPPAPPPPPPPPVDGLAPPPPPHAHIPVSKGGATLSELLAKRVKRTAEDLEEGKEPVWTLASAQYLQPKSKTGFVGLSNQGATCYLNSLIQTLYMTPELRDALYAWTYDPEFDGPEERCIPLHLQRLFLRLQLGSAAIIDTKELTTSFGWTGSEAFQQHDVQELLRKLFEALDVCLTRGATAIRSKPPTSSNTTSTEPSSHSSTTDAQRLTTHETAAPPIHNPGTLTAHIVNDLYEGVLLDYIRCMECNFARERKDPFFDVPISIRDVDSLEAGIEKYLAPEVLSDGNQWNCEQCGTKVDAFKGLQFQRLPYFLSLQLNRFDYDYTTWRRIKLNNKVTFPLDLDMTRFYSEGSDVSSGAAPGEKRHQYELFSVMIHSGGAEGGHYFAFVKSFENGKWYKFNDSSVTEISDEDIGSVFGGAAPKNQPQKAPLAATEGENASPPVPPPAAQAKAPLHSGYSTNAYMLIYRLVDVERNKRMVESEAIPEQHLEWIQKENAEFERLRAEHQKRLDNVALTVYYEKALGGKQEEVTQAQSTANPHPSPTEGLVTFAVNIDKHETLAAATSLVYQTALSRGLSLPSSSQCVRLRPFAPHTGTKSPAWLSPSTDTSTLEQLNFSHQKNVYLEVKPSEDIAWVDEDVFYTLGVIKFVPSPDSGHFEPAVSLRVPWRATLHDLKSMISSNEQLSLQSSIESLKSTYADVALEPGSDATSDLNSSGTGEKVHMRIFAVDSSANCRELKGEEGVLNEIHRLNDGQCVHLEYLPPGALKSSLVAAKFDEERHKVQIFYNLLESPTFEPSVLIDSRKTLGDLKAQIASALDLQPSEFKMCRNLLGREFNNMELTLAGANLYEGSAVCLVRGRPRNVNEFKLKACIFTHSTGDEDFFTPPWMVSIDESCTVEQLRAKMASEREVLDFLVAKGKAPSVEQAASMTLHIRLREKKANRCSSVLFDGGLLKDAMDKLMDGDEVAIQVLDAPDTLTRNQLLLVFRRWVPLLRELEPNSFELVVPKDATMGEARQLLSEHLSKLSSTHTDANEGEKKYAMDIPLQYLVVSKPYLFMIKKKDAAALSGLNWELADDVQLTQSPWYLVDGTLLLFKDMRDPEHGVVEASAVGSGNGQPKRAEQRLTIHTIYDDSPSPTPSSQ